LRKGSIKNFSKVRYKLNEIPSQDLNRRDREKSIAKMADDLINQGYYEVQRPDCDIKLHPALIEWDYGPFVRDFKPIEESSFKDFENQFTISIPSSYKWFISRMNNVKPMWELSHFRLKSRKWKEFQEIYPFQKVFEVYRIFHTENNLPKEYLPFASDIESGILLINTKSYHILHYAKTGDLIDLGIPFKEFIGSCAGISEYFYPIQYHIEKGNATTLDNWFKKGGKLIDIKTLGKRSVLQDTMDIELLKILLKNGANPNDVHIYGDVISRDCLDLFIEYGLDLKAKMEEEPWVKKQLSKRNGFEDLIEK